MDVGTKISANKAFRIFLARVRRVALLLMDNLVKEVRPHQLKSVVDQALSQQRAARLFAVEYQKASAEREGLEEVFTPLERLLEDWSAFLTAKRDDLDRYSQQPAIELDGQPYNTLVELQVELEKLDEGLVDIRRIAKTLENTSEDENASGG